MTDDLNKIAHFTKEYELRHKLTEHEFNNTFADFIHQRGFVGIVIFYKFPLFGVVFRVKNKRLSFNGATLQLLAKISSSSKIIAKYENLDHYYAHVEDDGNLLIKFTLDKSIWEKLI
jgi:hypothetical protein